MKLLNLLTTLALLLQHPSLTTASDDAKKSKPSKPCTIRSPTSGAFFDLNAISVAPPKSGKKASRDDRAESWHARGYDYNANFTINFCAPVVEELEDVVGVEKALWGNVSAFYEMDGKTYSIGNRNSYPVFRGRKLVLNYTDGSPCATRAASRSLLSHEPQDLRPNKLKDHDKDKNKDKGEDDDDDRKPPKVARRKSTIISLLCEKELAANQATISFVGSSADECAYFFEARSAAACGGIEVAQQQLGPGGVFGVIAFIAVLVYLVGGCVYQRTVMHQRGWRQLPNYSMWAGIGGFIRDMFIILTSSCARFLPSRRGYSRVSLNGSARGRGSQSDDENRLIDQLDEEWDD